MLVKLGIIFCISFEIHIHLRLFTQELIDNITFFNN